MKKISILLVLLLSYVSSVFAPVDEPIFVEYGYKNHGVEEPLRTRDGEEGKFYDAPDPDEFRAERFKDQKVELLGLRGSVVEPTYNPNQGLTPFDLVKINQETQVKQQQDQQFRLDAELPTVKEVVSGEPLFEQAPLDNGITPQDLQALIDRAQIPGEAQKVLDEIDSDLSIGNKRDAVAAVASHVLKSAVDAVFGKDPLTPLELTKREEDLKALLAVDVLTDGKAFMEQLLNELNGVTEKTISLQPDIVIATLSQAENAFRSGIISREDGWNIAMEIKQKLEDAGMLTPAMNDRIMASFSVFNRSTGRDGVGLLSVVPLPSDINTADEFFAYIKSKVDAYAQDTASSFSVQRDQIVFQINQALKILPAFTEEQLNQLQAVRDQLDVIYEQKHKERFGSN